MPQRPSWMPGAGSAPTSQHRLRDTAARRAAERWFVDKDGMPEPSAELLASLRKLDDENLRKAYGSATLLVRQELARLAEFSKITGLEVITEDGQPAAGVLPEEFYAAAAICLAGLDRLAAMRTRSAKARDDMFAEVSDEELNRNLARAMAQLLEEVPLEDLEQMLRRRRNLDAAEAGAPRWGRRVHDEEAPALELGTGAEDEA